MKNKNILLIVLFVIILIIALTLVLVNGKNKNIVNEPYQSNVQEMKQYELNIEEEIKKELEECEKDYKESIKKYSNYTRNDFYNEIRLNQNQEYCKISIVNKDDINIDDAYDLNGEKIDLVLYSTVPEEFIANALSPAKNVNVSIMDEKNKEALAITDDENLSLAIGKKGINIKLASKLTKYTIKVKTLNEINEEINK